MGKEQRWARVGGGLKGVLAGRGVKLASTSIGLLPIQLHREKQVMQRL